MEHADKGARELKEILRERGVDFSDCVEKSDLLKRLEETASQKPVVEIEVISDHI